MTESVSPATGRVNIALTQAAEHAAKRIKERFPFSSQLEVARVGAAFALREGLPLTRPGDLGPLNGSNYNVGSVDPQGEFKDLLLALHPEIAEDPYRVIETLMSVGTIELDKRIAAGQILSLRDLIDSGAAQD